MVGYCRPRFNADVYQDLFETACIPLGWEDVYWRKKFHLINSATGPLHQNRPAAVGGMPDSGGLAAIIAGPEPARLRCLMHFSAKVLVMPHADMGTLRPHITTEYTVAQKNQFYIE
jgi:hypothetical protein